MSLFKVLFAGLLVLPIAEIVTLFLVALAIGWILALALLLAGSMAGAVILQRQGLQKLVNLRDALARGGIRRLNLDTPGLAPILGAFLLLVPGFITDCLGLAVLIPPLRRRTGAAVTHLLRRRPPAQQDGPPVIDLKPGEWRQVTGESSRPARKRRRN